MCHPSLSALRARFHNIQCSWEAFPAFCSSLSSYFWYWCLRFVSVHSLVNIRTEDFLFPCSFCANLAVFSYLVNSLIFFRLILHIVSRVPGTHLFVFVSLQSQYSVFLRRVETILGCRVTEECSAAKRPRSVLPAGDPSVRPASSRWQRGCGLDPASGSKSTAGDVRVSLGLSCLPSSTLPRCSSMKG